MTLFSFEWAQSFATSWNATTGRSKLAITSTGPTAFCVQNAEAIGPYCVLEWDECGQVTVSFEAPLRRFEGSNAAWQDLMQQRVSAVASVMSGRIRYHGDFGFLIRVARGFDRVAVVAAGLLPPPPKEMT
ncbi:hypothetical protein [Hydrogenophaga luteola]|uniref:SCP2 domain-containing protein n=1 Tax=Hydrogenophaga luteola TaxID=1591122 RepID=A0ABV7W882_9BURK